MTPDLDRMADEASELLGGVFTGAALAHNRERLRIFARAVAAACYRDAADTAGPIDDILGGMFQRQADATARSEKEKGGWV